MRWGPHLLIVVAGAARWLWMSRWGALPAEAAGWLAIADGPPPPIAALRAPVVAAQVVAALSLVDRVEDRWFFALLATMMPAIAGQGFATPAALGAAAFGVGLGVAARRPRVVPTGRWLWGVLAVIVVVAGAPWASFGRFVAGCTPLIAVGLVANVGRGDGLRSWAALAPLAAGADAAAAWGVVWCAPAWRGGWGRLARVGGWLGAFVTVGAALQTEVPWAPLPNDPAAPLRAGEALGDAVARLVLPPGAAAWSPRDAAEVWVDDPGDAALIRFYTGIDVEPDCGARGERLWVVRADRVAQPPCEGWRAAAATEVAPIDARGVVVGRWAAARLVRE